MGNSKLINIKMLKYDPLNPRLPKAMRNQPDDIVLDYMVRNGNITELMESIAVTDYNDAEPLLVIPDQDEYLVVEGNRRLTAIKLLNNPSLAKIRKQTISDIAERAQYNPHDIPCVVYETRNEILNYLGYRHITGIKEWGALEKARYLDQLYCLQKEAINEPKQIYFNLARIIGSRSDYVRKLHLSYLLYEMANNNAYFDTGIEEEEVSFSYYTTALGNISVQRYLGLKEDDELSIDAIDSDHYKKLFKWLFDPKKAVVKEVRQISMLAKVLESDVAIKKLEEGLSLSEAILYTSQPEETFVELLEDSKIKLQQAKGAIEQLSRKPQIAITLITDIEKLCKSIMGALNENFDDFDGSSSDLVREMLDDPSKMDKLLKLLKLLESDI